jgi:nucleotidyltransferase/DNA polymerase involved in DNA repair
MLLARLATAKAKPDGLFIVPTSTSSSSSSSLSPTLQFMSSVPLSALPGVGRKLLKKLLTRSGGKTSVYSGLGDAAHGCRDEQELGPQDEDEEGEGEGEGSLSAPAPAPALEFCRDLWAVPLSSLAAWLGGPALAKSLFEACRGQDQRRLQSMEDIGNSRKSVGAEVNYGHRYESDAQGTAMEKAENFLRSLCEEVVKRLVQVSRCVEWMDVCVLAVIE